MARVMKWTLATLVMVAAMAVGVLAGPARTALAHASLVSSTPVANSVLELSPLKIELQFSEPIEAGLASIQLFDGSGRKVGLGDPTAGAGDATVVAEVPTLGDGVYAVVWRVTSAGPTLKRWKVAVRASRSTSSAWAGGRPKTWRPAGIMRSSIWSNW